MLKALPLALCLLAGCTKNDVAAELAPQPIAQPVAVSPPAVQPAGQRVQINVAGEGYTPSSVAAKANEPLTLVFLRTTDQSCGQRLVFPDKNIERDLPLNQPVEVTLTPTETGTIAFTCGMAMYKGTIVVQ